MPRQNKVFVAFGFDDYAVDEDGQPSLNGISNKEVGLWFCKQLREIGGDHIEVVVIEDPPIQRISSQVMWAIDEADAVICIFCKRVECQIKHLWTTSEYVLSESGYAASRFRDEADNKIFGFVENKVDSEKLGLAFPKDRTVHMFRRMHLDEMKPKLAEIISTLKGNGEEEDIVEHLLLEKTVTICADGRAEIQARHRFRIRRKALGFRMQHTLWRVRENLPPFEKLEAGIPGKSEYYLKCILIEAGRADISQLAVHLKPVDWVLQKRVGLFTMEIPERVFQPGDIVEYQFAWSYPNAFLAVSDLENWESNSAGLRAGSFGPISQVCFRLMFERNWRKREIFPSIELSPGSGGPEISISNDTNLPEGLDPREYWHRKGTWKKASMMQHIRNAHSALYEVYEWKAKKFSGMVKATWKPAENFHQRLADRPGKPAPPPNDKNDEDGDVPMQP